MAPLAVATKQPVASQAEILVMPALADPAGSAAREDLVPALTASVSRVDRAVPSPLPALASKRRMGRLSLDRLEALPDQELLGPEGSVAELPFLWAEAVVQADAAAGLVVEAVAEAGEAPALVAAA